MPVVIESDVCIIGGGITAAMVAEKLADERDARILVVEAGGFTTPLEDRGAARRRFLEYGENPWRDDHIRGHTALGDPPHGFSPSMTIGGLAMHWGGTTPRFSPDDFRLRSLYGVADDWPIDYDDLDPYYQDAEERIGVAGEQGPAELDPRSRPYPMPPLPLSPNMRRFLEWGERAGITFWRNPVAKNSIAYRGRNQCARCDTCNICPTGAKYSPDFTFNALLDQGRIELLTHTLVRRLVLEDRRDRVAYATAVDRNEPDEPVELRARTFVLAAGYTWSPYLLLLSANDRFPDGLANRSSRLVGKYMNGHRGINAYIELPMQLFPGIYTKDSLVSKQFMRPGRLDRYLRHDLRIWESTVGREPRLRDDDGRLLLGDEILADWRRRTENRGTARVRAYYDVLPARESSVTLDLGRKNSWGDPLPRLEFRDSEETQVLQPHTEAGILEVFERMARAGDGKIGRAHV